MNKLPNRWMGPEQTEPFAVLSDGTRVEMKYFRNSGSREMVDKRASRAFNKAKSQLAKRCSGKHPAMLIIPNQQSRFGGFQNMANAIGSKLTRLIFLIVCFRLVKPNSLRMSPQVLQRNARILYYRLVLRAVTYI